MISSFTSLSFRYFFLIVLHSIFDISQSFSRHTLFRSLPGWIQFYYLRIQHITHNGDKKESYVITLIHRWTWAKLETKVTFLFLFSSPGLHVYSCNRISASANGNYRLRHHPEIRERTCLIVISGTAACRSRQRGLFSRKRWYISSSFCKSLKKRVWQITRRYPASQFSLLWKTRTIERSKISS